MTLAVEQFIKSLDDSGVIARGKLEPFIPPKAHPLTSEQLAEQLVAAKHLTRYQAQRIYQGQAQSLLVGNYTVLDRIGVGHLVPVFKAEHRRMQRVVALKSLPSGITHDSAALARLLRDVESAAKLEHPNIIAVYDTVEAEGARFLVMQYFEGVDVASTVASGGPFPPAKAVTTLLQAARALDYAGKKEVADRAITPARMLIDNRGAVKLLNMGLSRLESLTSAQTLTDGSTIGGAGDRTAASATFRSARGGTDDATVMVGLGQTLGFMLTGADPPPDRNADRAPKLALPTTSGAIRRRLQTVYAELLAQPAADRYVSLAEAIGDLELLASELTASRAPRSSPAKPHATRPDSGAGRRGPFPMLPAIACIVAGLLLALAFAVGPPKPIGDGSLTIRVNQSDAAMKLVDAAGGVVFSGMTADQTPVSVQTPPGTYRLSITKAGFDPWEKSYTVKPGRRSDVYPTLVRKPGSVVHSAPFDRGPSEFALGEWQDVLDLVDLDRHALNGVPWTRTADGVTTVDASFPRLILPVQVSGDFQLAVSFTRTSPGASAIVAFPVDDETETAVEIGGYESRGSGILDLDGRSPWNNSPSSSAAVVPAPLTPNHRYTALIEVSNHGSDATIDVRLDGQPYFSFTGAKNRLSRRADDTLPATHLLALGTYKSALFHEVKLRPLSGGAWSWKPDTKTARQTPPAEIRDECTFFNGKWYWFSQDVMTFSQAARLAESMQGRLLEVRSRTEHDNLVPFAAKRKIWLNAFRDSRPDHATGWRNDRGEPLTYFGPWGDGQPDGPDQEFRLELDGDQWHDYPLGDRAIACIEWGPVGER